MHIYFRLLLVSFLFQMSAHAELSLSTNYFNISRGVPFSEQLSVYDSMGNQQSNIHFSASYLPSGVKLSNSGVLSGILSSGYNYDYSDYVEIQIYLQDISTNWVNLELYTNDDLIDEDDDGMHDQYEKIIINSSSDDSISLINDVLRDDNFDGDLYSNIEEYLLGFNPTIVDGNEPDSVIEGLLLVRSALSNEYDSVYVDLINECFTKALTQEPGNYRIRVYRALANIFLLAQREELHELVEDFGYFLTDERVHSETEAVTQNDFNFDFDNSPSIDFAKGVLFSNIVTLIDQSLDDLNYVPDGWTSYVEFSSVYFQSDDTVYVDAADIIALKGILNLFKSYMLTFSAYQINHPPYREIVMPNIVTNVIITLDGNNDDWSGIEPYMIGSQYSEYKEIKCAKDNTNLYLWVDFKSYCGNTNQFYVDVYREIELNNFEGASVSSSLIIPSGLDSFESVVYLDQSYSNAVITVDELVQEGSSIDVYDDSPLDKNILEADDLLATVDTNLMAQAKDALKLGIDLFQQADQKINARTDLLMHLIEYELDEEFVEERQEFISAVQDFEDYLTSTNNYIYELKDKRISLHHDDEHGHDDHGDDDHGDDDHGDDDHVVHDDDDYEEVYVSNTYTNAVYLGAFFEPDFVDLSLLPEFESHIDHPKMRELPDPTIGGILPYLTQEELSEIWMTQDNETVASIEVIGTNIVLESSTSQYQVVAHYLNGTSEDVTSNSTFIINDENYLIDGTNGVLTTPQLFTDESIVLSIDFQSDELFLLDLSILVMDTELREALDNYELIWSTGGTSTNQGWSGQGFNSYDGEDAAKSGLTSDEGISWLEASTSGSGSLSFWYKISSEPYADRLQFSVDGQNPTIISFGGEEDWTQQTIEIPSNSNHVFRWEYVKDKNTTSGQDSVWIDQVMWSGSGSTNNVYPVDSFRAWAIERNIIVADTDESWSAAFVGDHDGDGIPNGIEYSFGSNMSMTIEIIHDEPGLQISKQVDPTTNYVDINVHATTNLTDWDLEVSEIPGAPDGHKWYAPTNIPNNAFYKVDASIREILEN